MPKRLILAAAASAAVLSLTPVAAQADAEPPGPAPAGPSSPGSAVRGPAGVAAPDDLLVTVTDAGAAADGVFRLECNAEGRSFGGTHPDSEAACDRLGRMAADGRDPFAATPPHAVCTMQYGGPATAQITGTWHGRRVDTRFARTDGCEIGRWNAMVPVLPALGRA